MVEIMKAKCLFCGSEITIEDDNAIPCEKCCPTVITEETGETKNDVQRTIREDA